MPRSVLSLGIFYSCKNTANLSFLFIRTLMQAIFATAIEAVSAYLALRQADCLDQLLDGIKLQGSQTELACNLIHHLLILRRTGGSILLQILIGITLKLFDDTTGNQLHRTLGRGEVDERTSINQRRTSDTHVAFFQTSLVEKHLHVVTQLGTTHDTIITELSYPSTSPC